MDDIDIIKLYLERNEQAISQTAEKYGIRLRKISYGITEDMQASEECENDTYLEAWNSIPPNEPINYFYAFLVKIIRHISFDYCRKKNALKRAGDIVTMTEELESCIPGYNDVEERIDAKILGEAINRYLKKISLEKRVIFIRRYFYCDSIVNISKRMKLSESKVKTSIFRMRNELRSHLKKEGYVV